MTDRRPTLLVTGGAGFIGSALVRRLLAGGEYRVVNLDALTYAGHLASLGEWQQHPDHCHVHGDIADAALVRAIFEEHAPVGVMHLAAESHVDRSIDAPEAFLHTNVQGTFTLLQEVRRYLGGSIEPAVRERFRFVHVSTDEVFGSLAADAPPFVPEQAYHPSSPYSASKAAADHLVRAWWRTYGVPVVVTNCSNNYGPYQLPEKLIPLMILRAVAGESLPVYGSGANIRDWLYVDDHAAALQLAVERGVPGATYLVGGNAEQRNLDVVRRICDLVDARLGRSGAQSTHHQIAFVDDRPGHDFRYAINATATCEALGWVPQESFASGLARTVDWYIENADWCARVMTGSPVLDRQGLQTTPVAMHL